MALSACTGTFPQAWENKADLLRFAAQFPATGAFLRRQLLRNTGQNDLDLGSGRQIHGRARNKHAAIKFSFQSRHKAQRLPSKENSQLQKLVLAHHKALSWYLAAGQRQAGNKGRRSGEAK